MVGCLPEVVCDINAQRVFVIVFHYCVCIASLQCLITVPSTSAQAN